MIAAPPGRSKTRGSSSTARARRRGLRAPEARRRTSFAPLLADAVRCATREGARNVEVTHVLRAALAAMDDPRARLGATPERVIAGLDAAPADCVET